MKSIIAFLLLVLSLDAPADLANGALLGISNAMQNWGAQNAEREREARQQQYEIAREQRMEAAMQERRQQQSEFDRQDAIRQKAYQDQEQARRVELYQQQQTQILEMHHPDWKEINASKEFTNWKVMLPLATKETLNTTWDGAYLSEAMSAFKEWKLKNHTRNSKRKLKS